MMTVCMVTPSRVYLAPTTIADGCAFLKGCWAPLDALCLAGRGDFRHGLLAWPRDSARSTTRGARSAAENRARLHTLGSQDSGDRRNVAARARRAGLHRPGPLPGARVDGMDAGLSVRLRAAAVRRHRRARV